MTNRKLKYRPAAHAIERLREYFGVKEIHALDFSNESMVKAQFVTNQTDGRRLYKNDELDVMIVVAEDNTIITYLPALDKRREIERTGKPLNPVISQAIPKSITSPTNARIVANPVIAAAHATIQRELAKARRSFTAELRKLKIEQAELGVEIARATVNKVRCMAPHTQALIQQRIDAMQTYYDVVGTKIAQESADYSRVKTEAQAFIGEVVSV